jgi:hypothetical protein
MPLLEDLLPLVFVEAAPSVAFGVPEAPKQVRHGRTTLRYRLLLTSSGALKHAPPEPVVARTAFAAAGGIARRRTTDVALETRHAGRLIAQSLIASRIDTTGAWWTSDPDEWIALDDPAFS